MKHHFADLLDRENGYWTIVPNRDRYCYPIDSLPENLDDVLIVTISRHDKNWEQVFSLKNLEELTLNHPGKEQLASINRLSHLTRLRISHCRLKNIDFIRPLVNVEELVLEYVSGFSDLSPLRSLEKLRSVHFENLRKVSNFEGLAGIKNLKYLYITGTLDWNQPVDNFDFLYGLPNLEVLALIGINNKTPYPALKPLLSLKNLKKIRITNNLFPTEEYALIESTIPKVHGAVWNPVNKYTAGYSTLKILPKKDYRSKLSDEELIKNHPEVKRINGNRLIKEPNPGWFVFLGKKAGGVKCNNPLAEEKCNAFKDKYNAMKNKALEEI